MGNMGPATVSMVSLTDTVGVYVAYVDLFVASIIHLIIKNPIA
jgi:hypothetical protein